MPAVRVNDTTHRILRELSERDGEPMPEILAKAVEDYRRRRFLEGANVAFAALRENPDAWEEELEEREIWDSTLADGLGD